MEPLQGTLLGGDEPAVVTDARVERLRLDESAWVDVARGWLRGADTLLDALVGTVDWRQGRRWMYERMVDDPRLSRWYPAHERLPHPALANIRDALSAQYRVPLGSVGLNYYRDGRDSVAFHSDRELRHLDDTIVAIVTLGAVRPFLIRPRAGGSSHNVRPGSGDLLVMGGRAQRGWEHAVPKVAVCGPRVSVSLRWSSGLGPEARPPAFARRPHG